MSLEEICWILRGRLENFWCKQNHFKLTILLSCKSCWLVIKWRVSTGWKMIQWPKSHLSCFPSWWQLFNKSHDRNGAISHKIMKIRPNQAAVWSQVMWRQWLSWWTWCCNVIFHGWCDVEAESITVQKYCDAALFCCLKEIGMFLYMKQCNLTVLHLNWQGGKQNDIAPRAPPTRSVMGLLMPFSPG